MNSCEIVSSGHNKDSVHMNSHEIVSSGHNRDAVYMNSQQLWLPTQYLHKIMPVNIPSWMRKDHEDSNLELLTVDGCYRRKSHFPLEL